ncbi:hypothetical protein AB0B57_34045 [Micromonospora sp. NPDC049101]|uniref:hypothetical protein n=1 Tax=Micromonospora sp. NPDC049101 TaxID=3155032 RepID=UPI003406FF2A
MAAVQFHDHRLAVAAAGGDDGLVGAVHNPAGAYPCGSGTGDQRREYVIRPVRHETGTACAGCLG